MSRQKAAGFFWFQGSWWVLLFCAFVSLAYLHALKGRNAALGEMAFRFGVMEKEKMTVLQEQEDLRMRIASQNDPAWIEMVLMREIGVVPEGWMKVHFTR